MTWGEPLPWQVVFDPDRLLLTLHDEAGQPQATVGLPDGSIPEDPDTGSLERAMRSIVTPAEFSHWTHWRGRLLRGVEGVVTLPDAAAGRVWNGSATGWRRTHRTGRIRLPDRDYAVHHPSRARSQVLREGRRLVTLRRVGWYRRTGYGDDTGTVRVRTDVVGLDSADQLAVMIAATVCGPPGRAGAFTEWAAEVAQRRTT